MNDENSIILSVLPIYLMKMKMGHLNGIKIPKVKCQVIMNSCNLYLDCDKK